MTFFAYSGKDTPFIDAVYELLYNNNIENIWYAPKSIKPFDAIDIEIETAIRSATNLTFFMSPNSLDAFSNRTSYLTKEKSLIQQRLSSDSLNQFVIINIESSWDAYYKKQNDPTEQPLFLSVFESLGLTSLQLFTYVDLSAKFDNRGVSRRLNISDNDKTNLLKLFR